MFLITCPVHESFLQALKDKDYPFLYLPTITYDELYPMVDQATGIVVSTGIPIDRKIIDRATSLKWIGRIGSGMEHIDLDYAAQKNIRCCSSPEGNGEAVAEHAVGLIISLLRNIVRSHHQVLNHEWKREPNRGIELGDKTIGIIGYGNTGSALAKKLSGFGMKILAHDKYKSRFQSSVVQEAGLEQIQDEADIISFHLPLNPETLHYANDHFFNQLKRSPYIINTSRGKIVDTKALLDGLEVGTVKGAALDVLENEKINQWSIAEKEMMQKLMQQPQVIITPHIAGYSFEATYKMSKVLLEKLGI